MKKNKDNRIPGVVPIDVGAISRPIKAAMEEIFPKPQDALSNTDITNLIADCDLRSIKLKFNQVGIKPLKKKQEKCLLEWLKQREASNMKALEEHTKNVTNLVNKHFNKSFFG